jgi:hypothetical protein
MDKCPKCGGYFGQGQIWWLGPGQPVCVGCYVQHFKERLEVWRLLAQDRYAYVVLKYHFPEIVRHLVEMGEMQEKGEVG